MSKRLAPTVVAAAFAAVYVIVSPPSLDLAAHLLRAKLFSAEGFGIWDNWWYAGHHTPGYSVLFPAFSAALTPQLVAAIAVVATAALFELLAYEHFGADAWLGSVWFGAATATELFSGRLAFAFGLLPAVATALALQRRRPVLAAAAAFLTALCSPVAALFAALAGAAYAIGRLTGARRAVSGAWPGAAVVFAALVPVLALAVAFPEGGTEPFATLAFAPLPVIAVAALLALSPRERTLRTGALLYGLGCVVAWAIPSAVGGNAARLGPLVAGPLAALIWFRRRNAWLLAAALPLLYLQWQPAFRDVITSAGDPAGTTAYWQPLLSFLARQPGGPFRVEIPFTQFHWEAYEVAPRFPLARGWERQLDRKYNTLFYDTPLNPSTYHAWLHQLAVRFVAVSDATLDYSAVAETRLIDTRLSYLRLVLRTRHWRVYAVADPTPLASGAATAMSVGPDSVSLLAQRPGNVLLRVRFTPYWALATGSGCVAPDGDFTRLSLHRAGVVRLVIRFSLARIDARSPRCS